MLIIRMYLKMKRILLGWLALGMVACNQSPTTSFEVVEVNVNSAD